eukprot:TRINITY_DN60519_c0_g1_i1.p1 TRINITY_DN60519_c0_g1~~TRINITY_DN60519_c0_g1_i1.p1  ORF type:complete len:510 (+),score=46.06 TRINITY_DN60519_c0_g1_i1:54-1583(+)
MTVLPPRVLLPSQPSCTSVNNLPFSVLARACLVSALASPSSPLTLVISEANRISRFPWPCESVSPSPVACVGQTCDGTPIVESEHCHATAGHVVDSSSNKDVHTRCTSGRTLPRISSDATSHLSVPPEYYDALVCWASMAARELADMSAAVAGSDAMEDTPFALAAAVRFFHGVVPCVWFAPDPRCLARDVPVERLMPQAVAGAAGDDGAPRDAWLPSLISCSDGSWLAAVAADAQPQTLTAYHRVAVRSPISVLEALEASAPAVPSVVFRSGAWYEVAANGMVQAADTGQAPPMLLSHGAARSWHVSLYLGGHSVYRYAPAAQLRLVVTCARGTELFGWHAARLASFAAAGVRRVVLPLDDSVTEQLAWSPLREAILAIDAALREGEGGEHGATPCSGRSRPQDAYAASPAPHPCVPFGRGVLVHCMAGRSRSATIVAAYIMARFGVKVEAAVQFLQTRRRCAQPNRAFIAALHSHEERLWSLLGGCVGSCEVGDPPETPRRGLGGSG